jgi:hypothetical protein
MGEAVRGPAGVDLDDSVVQERIWYGRWFYEVPR